jgi:protein-L-isoaspartate(D-aspartate) O-methyltransferase
MVEVTSPAHAASDPSARLRRAMIDGQLRVDGVNDPVLLTAFDTVPREDFVPAERRSAAYSDRRQPLGHGRFLVPPISHGHMLLEARPGPDDRVLLIGGGTGYLAALLEPMVASLDVVESEPALVEAAPVRAGRWTIGPLAEGAPEGAPYTLLLIDGAIEQLPDSLVEQIGDDGRVVCGLLERGVTRLAVGRKAAGRVAFLMVDESDFPLLDDFRLPRRWSF